MLTCFGEGEILKGIVGPGCHFFLFLHYSSEFFRMLVFYKNGYENRNFL